MKLVEHMSQYLAISFCKIVSPQVPTYDSNNRASKPVKGTQQAGILVCVPSLTVQEITCTEENCCEKIMLKYL